MNLGRHKQQLGSPSTTFPVYTFCGTKKGCTFHSLSNLLVTNSSVTYRIFPYNFLVEAGTQDWQWKPGAMG
jgi:hypothetical protein